jgi:DNA-directed RNA polymerase specialized sigma24 family protein
VVQSAYRSFFAHAERGDYVIERAGDLWRILAAITINKLRGQIERHTAQRRDVRREATAGGNHQAPAAHQLALDDEPTADEAAAIAEQLRIIMAELTPLERTVLELRLSGGAIDEISTGVRKSERTVRRVLQQIRDRMEQRLLGDW